MSAPVDRDEDRWAEARSLLNGVPDESVQQRLRRWRRHRILAVVALVLLTAVLAAVVLVLADAPVERADDVPTWQVVTGFTIVGAGLLLQLSGLVVLIRGARRRQGGLTSPLAVLTRDQRKDLLAQVRGRRPADPARLPFARLLADQLIGQRAVPVSNAGLAIAFAGQWIASPSTWRAVLAVVYGVVLAVLLGLLQRDVRPARRFLATHPVD